MSTSGATIWARQTIDSEIFYKKPDKWFKIWFFIVNRVNHKQHREWQRGDCYIKTGEIETATGASKDEVKKCVSYLRKKKMVLTKRSTRGFTISVLKYNVYQDLGNYRSTREAPEKHQRSTTINKNDKNDKNNTPDGFEEFWKEYPKKVGKTTAEKAWGKANPDHLVVLRSLAKHKQTNQWVKDSGQFVPNPTTWINQKRWEDEVEATNRPITQLDASSEITL